MQYVITDMHFYGYGRAVDDSKNLVWDDVHIYEPRPGFPMLFWVTDMHTGDGKVKRVNKDGNVIANIPYVVVSPRSAAYLKVLLHSLHVIIFNPVHVHLLIRRSKTRDQMVLRARCFSIQS